MKIYREEIQIGREITEKLKAQAIESYPNECCGVLFFEPDNSKKYTAGGILEGNYPKAEKTPESKKIVITEAVGLVNRDEPDLSGRHYHISPLELYSLEKEYRAKGLEIAGFYHSHPDQRAILSEKDEKEMIPGMTYIILSVRNGEIAEVKGWKKEQPEENAREQNIYID